MSPSRTLETGQLVLGGRYRIVRLLAEGGMGAIYLARIEGAAGFTKPAVVKQILSDRLGEPRFIEMFAREARILARLRHPNIVSVLDFAEEGGSYLMGLDYVHGHHLGQWRRYVNITQGPFPVSRAVHIAIEVLQALHHAHTVRDLETGESVAIIHRDVKPSNILIDVGGQVKLVDFGVARAESDRSQVEAKIAPLKGTFTYMAPELFEQAPPTPSSDVYACGVVLHEVLAGKNEFRSPKTMVTIGRVLTHELSRLDQTRSDVPPGLTEVIARATSKAPAGRYQSAAEFAAALRELRGVDPHVAADEIRTAAQRDFRDSRFGVLLKTDDLSNRERSLRGAGTDSVRLQITTSRGMATGPDGPATVLGRPSRAMAVPSRRQTRRWVVGGVAIGLVLAGAAYAFVAFTPSSRPQIVVVQGAVEPAARMDAAAALAPRAAAPASPDAGTPTPTARADASAQRETVPLVAPAPVKRPPRAAPSASDPAALSRIVERRRGEVRACFASHVAEMQGMPQIAIAFQVDASGKVLSARVQPPAIAGTPLGGCIERIARTMQFGKQAQPLSFHIPITMRAKR
jgi:eukaryotic-like serine/threonine-protein kinase